MAQLKTINKTIAATGITLLYGSSGRIMFQNGTTGPIAFTGITWLNRLTPDEWAKKAADLAGQKAEETLVYSSRTALKRGLDRRGISIDDVTVTKTDAGKFAVTL
jgi:hypothetical protein